MENCMNKMGRVFCCKICKMHVTISVCCISDTKCVDFQCELMSSYCETSSVPDVTTLCFSLLFPSDVEPQIMITPERSVNYAIHARMIR